MGMAGFRPSTQPISCVTQAASFPIKPGGFCIRDRLFLMKGSIFSIRKTPNLMKNRFSLIKKTLGVMKKNFFLITDGLAFIRKMTGLIRKTATLINQDSVFAQQRRGMTCVSHRFIPSRPILIQSSR
jgi:hypothetical protein